MANLYTEDGMLLPTGSDFVMGIRQAKLEIVEVEHHGDTAIEVGQYTLSGEGNQVMDQGKYIVIWKQQNGQWKLHRDIWNSSVNAQQS